MTNTEINILSALYDDEVGQWFREAFSGIEKSVKKDMNLQVSPLTAYLSGGYVLSKLHDFEPGDVDIFLEISNTALLPSWIVTSTPYEEIGNSISKTILGDKFEVLTHNNDKYPISPFVTSGDVEGKKVQLIFCREIPNFDLKICEIFYKTDHTVNGDGLKTHKIGIMDSTAAFYGSRSLKGSRKSKGRLMKYASRGFPLNVFFAKALYEKEVFFRKEYLQRLNSPLNVKPIEEESGYLPFEHAYMGFILDMAKQKGEHGYFTETMHAKNIAVSILEWNKIKDQIIWDSEGLNEIEEVDEIPF